LNSCFVIRMRAHVDWSIRSSSFAAPVLGAVLAHRRHRDPVGKGDAAEAKWFNRPVFLPSEWARRFKSNSLIADDGAALVTYPIPEAQIVDPHVGKTGAYRRCGT